MKCPYKILIPTSTLFEKKKILWKRINYETVTWYRYSFTQGNVAGATVNNTRERGVANTGRYRNGGYRIQRTRTTASFKSVSVAIVNITRPGVETECNLHFMNGRMTSYWLHVTSHFTTTTPGPPPFRESTHNRSGGVWSKLWRNTCAQDALFFRQREKKSRSRSGNGPFHRLLALYPATRPVCTREH